MVSCSDRSLFIFHPVHIYLSKLFRSLCSYISLFSTIPVHISFMLRTIYFILSIFTAYYCCLFRYLSFDQFTLSCSYLPQIIPIVNLFCALYLILSVFTSDYFYCSLFRYICFDQCTLFCPYLPQIIATVVCSDISLFWALYLILFIFIAYSYCCQFRYISVLINLPYLVYTYLRLFLL